MSNKVQSSSGVSAGDEIIRQARDSDIDDQAGAGNLAEWYRRQGHIILRTQSGFWCDLGPRVYQSIPFFKILEPDESEIRNLLIKRRAVAVRYSTNMNSSQGMLSYHIICTDREYDISKLPRQTRQNIRKGLENCVVEQIPFERLALEGWRLHEETVKRQERRAQLSNRVWEAKCRATVGLPGLEAWSAIVDGELAAVLTLIRIGDWVIFLSQYSSTAHLQAKANHALIYFVTKNIMSRRNVNCIFYTLQSLDAPMTIDEFKIRMGYRPIPVKQHVVFHPLVLPLVNKQMLRMVRVGRTWRLPSSWLAKAEGLIRFSIDGRKPTEEQTIPDILQKHQDKEY